MYDYDGTISTTSTVHNAELLAASTPDDRLKEPKHPDNKKYISICKFYKPIVIFLEVLSTADFKESSLSSAKLNR